MNESERLTRRELEKLGLELECKCAELGRECTACWSAKWLQPRKME
jgi:hypothetical protein